jgi:hypothetical protein
MAKIIAKKAFNYNDRVYLPGDEVIEEIDKEAAAFLKKSKAI